MLRNFIFVEKFEKKTQTSRIDAVETNVSVWTDRHKEACSHFPNIANASKNIKRLRNETSVEAET
jgi:hypothetical protein